MVNVAIVGHVDNGKSSLLSRILYPDANGDPYKLDILPEEKERSITQEYSTHQCGNILFIDTAGHKSFIRSNIQAYTTISVDVALIVCSLRKGEFLSGFKNTLQEQLILLRCTGVQAATIVFTKGDLDLKEDISLLERELKKFLKSIRMKCLHSCVTSAATGEGIRDLVNYFSVFSPCREIVRDLPLAPVTQFSCEFNILFIPPNKIISAGSLFMAHFAGEEAECTLEKTPAHILRVNQKYEVVMKLSKPCRLNPSIIIRMCDFTIGFCKIKKKIN